FPRISLGALGRGTNIWSHGDFTFADPLPFVLEPFNVPVELINETPQSWTFIRGIKPWLASLKAWKDLQIGPPPDQVYFWALPFQLMQTYFAAPLPDASNQVRRIADIVLAKSPSNDLAGFRRMGQANGFEWSGAPYLSPYLQSIDTSNGPCAFGGMFPAPGPNPIAADKLPSALNSTNLVCYDWELTGARIEQWTFMSQFIRWVGMKAQLPDKAPSLECIRNIATHIGPTVTEIRRTAPNQLSFERHSTIGFTGIELNLLADWLESPRFPVGLYGLLTPAPKPPE
ncbi:MAG TPA: hypothetical protein VFD66_03865, partial [Verrucomicrobiae bacterium]|nr:hypothetical protein [Verrucomicrobiae bacterium]